MAIRPQGLQIGIYLFIQRDQIGTFHFFEQVTDNLPELFFVTKTCYLST
jgi:hypothetical protein